MDDVLYSMNNRSYFNGYKSTIKSRQKNSVWKQNQRTAANNMTCYGIVRLKGKISDK